MPVFPKTWSGCQRGWGGQRNRERLFLFKITIFVGEWGGDGLLNSYPLFNVTLVWSQEMLKPEDSSHCDLTTSYICVSSYAIYLMLCICYQVSLCFFLLPLKFSWITLLTRTLLRFHFSSFASRFVYIGCNSDLRLKAREVAYRGFQDFWIWNARKLHNVAAFPLLVARLLPKIQ